MTNRADSLLFTFAHSEYESDWKNHQTLTLEGALCIQARYIGMETCWLLLFQQVVQQPDSCQQAEQAAPDLGK